MYSVGSVGSPRGSDADWRKGQLQRFEVQSINFRPGEFFFSLERVNAIWMFERVKFQVLIEYERFPSAIQMKLIYSIALLVVAIANCAFWDIAAEMENRDNSNE